eukprot:1634917-Rhodomonas_salina.1
MPGTETAYGAPRRSTAGSGRSHPPRGTADSGCGPTEAGLGSRASGLGSRVSGLRSRVQGPGFRVSPTSDMGRSRRSAPRTRRCFRRASAPKPHSRSAPFFFFLKAQSKARQGLDKAKHARDVGSNKAGQSLESVQRSRVPDASVTVGNVCKSCVCGPSDGEADLRWLCFAERAARQRGSASFSFAVPCLCVH